jgi:hypothetical protein
VTCSVDDWLRPLDGCSVDDLSLGRGSDERVPWWNDCARLMFALKKDVLLTSYSKITNTFVEESCLLVQGLYGTWLLSGSFVFVSLLGYDEGVAWGQFKASQS